MMTRWWFQIFFFHPYLGKISNLTCAYFSDGLVKNHQPDYDFVKFEILNFQVLTPALFVEFTIAKQIQDPTFDYMITTNPL